MLHFKGKSKVGEFSTNIMKRYPCFENIDKFDERKKV